MTHSLDSFITDSANSATALYTGHKTSVNALGVYADSSEDSFDDPKVETIAEIFHRIWKGHVGIVSTAFIADATPAALTAHTRDRDQYGAVIDSFIHGIVNYTWTEWEGPDVLFGGGAENFCSPENGGETYMDLDYYNVFREAGYKVVFNNTELQASADDERTLGIFSTSNMAKWYVQQSEFCCDVFTKFVRRLDRNVYTDNLADQENSPDCLGSDAADQPGLKEMTLKAIDILNNKATSSGDKGWFIMSEAASIDKQMHALDYDRALGELLELDDTIKHAIAHLEELGVLNETLIVVTADHGHGFDVFGNVDTKYLNAQETDRAKRNAIGTYQNSGESQYVNTGNLRYADSNFPSNWDPRYTLAQGVGAFPDHRENYQVHKNGPRVPATNITGFPDDDFFVNPEDNVNGFIVNGTLPTNAAQGVHSLTDVPVFAMGPCQEIFGGVYSSIDVFFKMAECLGLGQTSEPGSTGESDGPGGNWDKFGGHEDVSILMKELSGLENMREYLLEKDLSTLMVEGVCICAKSRQGADGHSFTSPIRYLHHRPFHHDDSSRPQCGPGCRKHHRHHQPADRRTENRAISPVLLRLHDPTHAPRDVLQHVESGGLVSPAAVPRDPRGRHRSRGGGDLRVCCGGQGVGTVHGYGVAFGLVVGGASVSIDGEMTGEVQWFSVGKDWR
nr:alkaline phosphatase h [Quercus suber]